MRLPLSRNGWTRLGLRKLNQRARRVWWRVPLPVIQRRYAALLFQELRLSRAKVDKRKAFQLNAIADLEQVLWKLGKGSPFRFTPEELAQQQAVLNEALFRVKVRAQLDDRPGYHVS